MKIAVRGGHNPGVPGASGIVSEVIENRKYYPAIIKYLQALGQEVKDVTPPYNTSTSAEDLNYGIKQANDWGADILISCHINASGGGARGSVTICSNSALVNGLGKQVNDAIVALGFPIREGGARLDTRGLFEINNAPKGNTLILEPFFCDNAADVALYKAIGPDALGKAIAEAIVGKKSTVIPTPVVPTPAPAPAISGDATILKLQQAMNKLRFTDGSGRVLVEDGINGTNTKAAVKKFQSTMGIGVDGIAGATTWSVIKSIQARPLCKIGSTGYAVRYLQFRFGASIDGKFGPVTANKAKIFQTSKSLIADGIVGSATWEKLIG